MRREEEEQERRGEIITPELDADAAAVLLFLLET